MAVQYHMKVFWPSSIAAFGPTTPRVKTPQRTVLEPTTMYGVTKVAGELLCQYYFLKYGVDVRSLRYPGIISWKTPPGGGTTDYAVAIFYEGLQKHAYQCFVGPKTKAALSLNEASATPTPEEKYIFIKNLSLGSTGTEVEELQKKLKLLGHLNLTSFTTYFGPLTEKAVIAFQKAEGIDPAGVVGPKTRMALNNK